MFGVGKSGRGLVDLWQNEEMTIQCLRKDTNINGLTFHGKILTGNQPDFPMSRDFPVICPVKTNQLTILVGGLEHDFDFSIQLGMSSSQLTNSYFSDGLKPPTRI